MPNLEEIATDFGIDIPDDTGTPDAGKISDVSSDSSIEARVTDVLSGKPETPEKSVVDDAGVEKPEDAAGAGEPEKPETETPVDFLEASKTAFLGEGGAVDTNKVVDSLLKKGKSFLQFTNDSQPPIDSPKNVDVVDPEKEYAESITNITNSLPDILADEANRGFTPEQTLARLQATFDGFTQQRDSRIELAKERDSLSGEYKGELNEIREGKVTARIDKNLAEMGSHLDGLIPGVPGRAALDKFVLDKNYGGTVLEWAFNRDNPDFKNVPEAERKEYTEKWFRSFQSNRGDLAMAAEVGRLKWALEQLPGIMGHAQSVGAAKAGNAVATKTGKGLPTAAPKSGGMSSGLSQFFGYDSVN